MNDDQSHGAGRPAVPMYQRHVEPGCVFCRIVSGEEPAQILHEDQFNLAFAPKGPATRGHTLVIPKAHAPDLWALAPEFVGPLFWAVRHVGFEVRRLYRPEGMNVIHSAGSAATQTVFHLHIHLVPRYTGDAMGPIWPSRAEPAGVEGDVVQGAEA